VVDLDELLNSLNARTRRGLSEFIQGTGEQYAGAGRALGRSIEYFAPFLSETNHFFSELVRDQRVFTSFLVETAKAVTTIGARSEPLTDLIENSNTTFSAIGSRQRQLAAGLRTLPRALRQGNRTFAELPSALTALKALVETSRPTTPSLNALFSHLRPLLSTATPVVRNFHLSFNRPGANNDLTDLAAALPALARTLTTASPATVTSLRESVPVTAFWGPYSPDLIGTFRTFGQAGSYYEGNGHYARVSPVFPLFHLEGNTLKPAAGTAQAFEALKSAQLRRCPGGATTPAPDGSSPFTDGELLSCDPLQVP
jgi:phospholipid/cholesterol/gamma-HCH transport system substrate-binding protein